jgi:hypothetical protein
LTTPVCADEQHVRGVVQERQVGELAHTHRGETGLEGEVEQSAFSASSTSIRRDRYVAYGVLSLAARSASASKLAAMVYIRTFVTCRLSVPFTLTSPANGKAASHRMLAGGHASQIDLKRLVQ